MQYFKSICAAFALALFLSATSAYAQQQPVTVNPKQPAPGQTVTITYHPNSTQAKIQDPDSLQLVFSYAPFQYSQPDSMMMKNVDDKWTAHVPLSKHFEFASFYFKSGQKTDKNQDGHHYTLMAYKDHKPVEGAYLMQAASLKKRHDKLSDKKESAMKVQLYKKELSTHPQSYQSQMDLYAHQLTQKGIDSSAVLAKAHQRINQKLAEDPGSWQIISNVQSGYRQIGEKAKGDSVQKDMIKQHPHSDIAMYDLFNKAHSEKDSVKQNQMLKKYVNADYDQSYINKYYTGLAYHSLFQNYAKQDSIEQMKAMAERWLQASPRKFSNPIKAQNYNEAASIIAKNTNQYDLALRYVKKAEQLTDQEPASSGYTIDKNGYQTFYIAPDQRKKMLDKRKADILATEGLIYMKQNKYDQAESSLSKAVQISDKNEDAQKYLAQLYMQTNRPQKAFTSYKQLLMKKPTDKALREKLKQSYLAYNGSAKGYKKQTKALHKAWHNKMEKKFKEEEINKTAPSLAHATDLNGQPLDTKALAGKVVVLDFWATWCGPCKASFPHMQKVYDQYKDNPNVQFVIMNSAWSNTRKQALKWTKKKDYTFPYYYDKNSKIITSYGVTGIPTTFLLSKEGHIKFKDVGYRGPSMEPKLALKIDMLLKQKGSMASGNP